MAGRAAKICGERNAQERVSHRPAIRETVQGVEKLGARLTGRQPPCHCTTHARVPQIVHCILEAGAVLVAAHIHQAKLARLLSRDLALCLLTPAM